LALVAGVHQFTARRPWAAGIAWSLLVLVGGWHITLGRAGLELAGSILARAWLSVLALSLLMATTDMRDVLKGLERLRAPRLLVMLMGFTHRYIFVLADEARRLKSGRDVRLFSRSVRLGIRSVGHMAGSLFLRSYARAGRVYGAMLLRAYDGTPRSLKTLRFRPSDLIFILSAVLIILTIYFAPELA